MQTLKRLFTPPEYKCQLFNDFYAKMQWRVGMTGSVLGIVGIALDILLDIWGVLIIACLLLGVMGGTRWTLYYLEEKGLSTLARGNYTYHAEQKVQGRKLSKGDIEYCLEHYHTRTPAGKGKTAHIALLPNGESIKVVTAPTIITAMRM